MSRSLRIAVADAEPHILDFYREALPILGHTLVAVAKTGAALVESSLSLRPDLVITELDLPDMNGLDAAASICPQLHVPIIVASAHDGDEFVERSEADCVMACLVKPIKPSDLPPTIALAVRRFAQFEAMRKEAADLRQALADRKVIERAKGLLMKKCRLDEENAFRRLQKLARDKNLKLAAAAHVLLLAEEALQPG